MDELWLSEYPEFERRHFWWRVRRGIVVKLVENHAAGRRLRVLDVGCGSGVTLHQLALTHQVLGIEPDQHAVAASQVAGQILVGKVETMEFAQSSFDVVLMLDVLEHLDEPREVLRKIRTWAAPSALLIATVPAYGWMWTTHDDRNHHRKRYTRRELQAEVSGSGWELGYCRYLFSPLVVPKLFQVLMERFGTQKEASRPNMPAPWLNAIAYWVLRLDARAAFSRAGRWWTGTSIVAVASPAISNKRSPET
jgi:SAM-dependent methyltransferase